VVLGCGLEVGRWRCTGVDMCGGECERGGGKEEEGEEVLGASGRCLSQLASQPLTREPWTLDHLLYMDISY
jgi:hypothetical protein